jgi:catechol 2,3-dioxygenase-like lactoylglutathione lyase family enzyme
LTPKNKGKRVTFGLTDQFHTGFIVRDLEAAVEGLRDVLGVRWTAAHRIDVDAWTQSGRLRTRLRYVYSVEKPHIELIETKAGTLWSATEELSLHHLGFWVDDLVAEAARLEELGLERELAGASDRNLDPHRVTYHRHRTGLRIELVDRVLEPSMEQLWREA